MKESRSHYYTAEGEKKKRQGKGKRYPSQNQRPLLRINTNTSIVGVHVASNTEKHTTRTIIASKPLPSLPTRKNTTTTLLPLPTTSTTIRPSYAHWLTHQAQSTWDELQRLDLQRLAKLDARARGRSGEQWAKRQQFRARNGKPWCGIVDRSRERKSSSGKEDDEAKEGRTATSKPMLLARMERLERHTTSQPASPFVGATWMASSVKAMEKCGKVQAATPRHKATKSESSLPGLRGGLDNPPPPALRNPARLGHTLYTQPRHTRASSSPDELDVLFTKALTWGRGVLGEREASEQRKQERQKKLKAKISKPVAVEHGRVVERVGEGRVSVEESLRPDSHSVTTTAAVIAVPELRRRSTQWDDFIHPTAVAPPVPASKKPTLAPTNSSDKDKDRAQKPKPLAFLKPFTRHPKPADAGRRPSDESFCCIGQSEDEEALELSEAAKAFLATNKPLPMPLQYRAAALTDANADESSSTQWASAFQTALPPAALEGTDAGGEMAEGELAYVSQRKAPPAPLQMPQRRGVVGLGISIQSTSSSTSTSSSSSPPPLPVRQAQQSRPQASTTEPPYQWRQSRVPFFRDTPRAAPTPNAASPVFPVSPAKDAYGRTAPAPANRAESSSSIYSVPSRASESDEAGRYWRGPSTERSGSGSEKTASTFYDLDPCRGTWVLSKRAGAGGQDEPTGSVSGDSEATFYDYESGRRGFVAKRRTRVPEEGRLSWVEGCGVEAVERPAPLRIAKVGVSARKRSRVAEEGWGWENPFEYDDEVERVGTCAVLSAEPSRQTVALATRPGAAGREREGTLLHHSAGGIRYGAFEWEGEDDGEVRQVAAVRAASMEVSPVEEGRERRAAWEEFRRGLRATGVSLV